MIKHGEEECALHRILCGVVFVVISFQSGGFSTSDKSSLSYQGLCIMRGALGYDPTVYKTRRISYICTDSSRNIFWIQKIFCLLTCWLLFIGMPVLTYGHLPYAWIWIYSIKNKFKRSCGTCLSPSYTRYWPFRKLHHLAILSNNT